MLTEKKLEMYLEKMDKLLRAMRRKEQRRKRKATKDFLARMNELEREALAEIESSVRTAKHKVLRIEERLYGPNSNIIERMLGTE